MNHNSEERLGNIAELFSKIQRQVESLSVDTAGMVYLFFVSKSDLSEISDVYGLPLAEVKRIIISFLGDLLSRSNELRQFLSRLRTHGSATTDSRTLPPERSATGKDEAELLIEGCGIPDSEGERVREMIGTAVRIGTPPVPDSLIAGILSGLDSIGKEQEWGPVKFPIDLKEQDFFLGKPRTAAESDAVPIAKTRSEGTVSLQRGPHKCRVVFQIELLEGTTTVYVIRFDNLPNWAIPASFSFVVPDEISGDKEYVLPSELLEGILHVVVENEEQELAFLDRRTAFLGFILRKNQT